MRNFKKQTSKNARQKRIKKRQFEIVNYLIEGVKLFLPFSKFQNLLSEVKAFRSGGGRGHAISGWYGYFNQIRYAAKIKDRTAIKFEGTNHERHLATRAKFGSKRRDKYMRRLAA